MISWYGIPYKLLIVSHTIVSQHTLQLLTDVVVVRLRVEVQVTHVPQQSRQLRGKILTQGLGRSRHLLLQDLLILFLLVFGVHVLPGQLPQKEVNEHVYHALKVIPSSLLYPEVGVDRGIPGSPCEVLVVLVGDMGAIQEILLGQSEVYHEYHCAFLIASNQKVVRLDISMNKPLGMNVFYAIQYLQSNHYDSFEGKGLALLLEQGLQ